MFAAHTAILGVVSNQVGQLTALLHEVAVSETRDFALEVAHSERFAQLEARVIEAQRLVEIRREQEMSRCSVGHVPLHESFDWHRPYQQDGDEMETRVTHRG